MGELSVGKVICVLGRIWCSQPVVNWDEKSRLFPNRTEVISEHRATYLGDVGCNQLLHIEAGSNNGCPKHKSSLSTPKKSPPQVKIVHFIKSPLRYEKL